MQEWRFSKNVKKDLQFFARFVIIYPDFHSGEVAEWSKAQDWKSCVLLVGTEGSNPSLSASLKDDVSPAKARPFLFLVPVFFVRKDLPVTARAYVNKKCAACTHQMPPQDTSFITPFFTLHFITQKETRKRMKKTLKRALFLAAVNALFFPLLLMPFLNAKPHLYDQSSSHWCTPLKSP